MMTAPQLCGSGFPRRVLMLCTAMGAGGGAEEQVVHLSLAMKQRGVDVRIVSMIPPGRMPAGFEGGGVPLTHLGMNKGIPDPRAVLRLARDIRDFAPDVVHTHMVHANLLGRFARMIRKPPVLVCTLHNLTMAGVKRDWSPIFEFAHRVTDRWCDHTTAICAAAAENAVRRRAVPAARMSVLQNGIDTTRFAPQAASRAAMRKALGLEDKFIWLAVGRLELQKAYPVMLKAVSQLARKNAMLLVCGRGSLADELKALAATLGIGDSVRFMGLRDDVPALMNAADGMVLSSDVEGLPLALLQAASSGLPMVVTHVGGNSEAVIEGVNGWLVPPQSPELLADRMAALMDMPADARMAAGLAGRKRICELYETERVVDRWFELYARLAEKNRRGDSAYTPRRGFEMDSMTEPVV